MKKLNIKNLYKQYSMELKIHADKFSLIWEERNKILEIYNKSDEENCKEFSELLQKNLVEMKKIAKEIEQISNKIQQLKDTTC